MAAPDTKIDLPIPRAVHERVTAAGTFDIDGRDGPAINERAGKI